jgi:hypothetical protein
MINPNLTSFPNHHLRPSSFVCGKYTSVSQVVPVPQTVFPSPDFAVRFSGDGVSQRLPINHMHAFHALPPKKLPRKITGRTCGLRY